MLSLDRVLVLAPHTDDGEFGCGGTISKFTELGKQVYYVAFSSAEKSVPRGMPKDVLKKEVRMATKELGISSGNLIVLNYPVRDFPTHRQNILEDMIKLDRDLMPNLVFLPSTNDTHQDHQTISSEGFRAFKKTSMVGYEMPYNNLSFNTTLFVGLSHINLDKKMNAVKCYKSQRDRSYATDAFVRGLAKVRGVQIGIEYAEAFEVIRWIMK